LYEEIDLRPYLVALFSNWMWIGGAAAVAALVAFGVSRSLPPTYEARAAVAIVEAREVVQFDSRFNSIEERQPLTAYPELATSDELVQQLLAEVGSDLPDVETVEGLRGMLEAQAGDHPSVVYLLVRHGDPETAAEVANAWATLFVAWAGDIYGTGDGEQLAFYENQLDQVEAELEAAEEALIAFEARNRSSILGNQLSALQDTQTRYLNQERSIRFLLQDMRDLRDQLANEAPGGAVSIADQLAAVSLQLQAFNASEGQPPLMLQTDAELDLTGKSRQEQVSYLENLIATMGTRLDEIDSNLNELEPQIMALQAEKEAVDVERARLNRDQTVAAETHEALARKVAEERIVAESTDQGVRLASQAAVPVSPAGPGWLSLTVISGMLGLTVGVTSVLALIWWRGEEVAPAVVGDDEEQMALEQQTPESGLAGRSGRPAFDRAESRT